MSASRVLNRWLRGKPSRLKARAQAGNRRRLAVEGLEDRCLLTISYTSFYGGETTTDGKGTKLNDPAIFYLFWGSYWDTDAGNLYQGQIVGAEESFISEDQSYWSALPQYGLGTGATFGNSVVIPGTVPSVFSDSNIQAVVQDAIDNVPDVPRPGSLPNNAIYMVIAPPGTSYSNPAVAGYHQAMLHSFAATDIQEEYYGFVEDSGVFNLDTYTTILSHELTEAKTDALVDSYVAEFFEGTGIEATAGASFPLAAGTTNLGEICDYEAQNYTYRLGGPGGVLVQSYWSAYDNAFVIGDGNSADLEVQTKYNSQGNVTSSYLDLNVDQLGLATNQVSLSVVSGGLQVVYDNQTFWFNPGAITRVQFLGDGTANNTYNIEQTLPNVPVTIILGQGSDVVNVCPTTKNLANIQGTLAIVDNDLGHASMTLNDQADTTSGTWSIDEGTASTDGSITRTGWAAIDFGPFVAGDSLTINGTDNPKTKNNINIYNIAGTAAGAPINLYVPFGAVSNVNVVDEAGGVTITTGGSNLVNVAIDPVAQKADQLDGDVTVNGGKSTSLIIYDGDDKNNDTWTFSTPTIASGPMSFGNQVNTIKSSRSANEIIFSGNLEGTPVAAATIDGGTGTETFNILGVMQGTTLTINGGAGKDKYNIQNTAAGSTVNLVAGRRNDTVNISSSAESLQTIQGDLMLDGSGGTNTIVFNDQKDKTPSTYVFHKPTVTRNGNLAITYLNFAHVTINRARQRRKRV